MTLKHQLYAEIEPPWVTATVVASSASGLTSSELQAGWRQPDRFVLGHPFNPPHLIPLVEVLGNARTLPGVVDATRDFYTSIGKITIEVRREVPGHVANRLQAALWREAIHLVDQGVATVEDVDTAVWAGPGLRWAAMGPTMLFHLGAGDGGLTAFCERYTDSFNRWWDDLGEPHLDESTSQRLVDGLAPAIDRSHGAELESGPRRALDGRGRGRPRRQERPRRPSRAIVDLDCAPRSAGEIQPGVGQPLARLRRVPIAESLGRLPIPPPLRRHHRRRRSAGTFPRGPTRTGSSATSPVPGGARDRTT